MRTYYEVEGRDASELPEQLRRQMARVARRLADVERVVAVLSGKGGVGKSLTAAALAAAGAGQGRSVGLLDADLAGPTAARMLGAGREGLRVSEEGAEPVRCAGGVRLVSTDLFLDENAPLRWRDRGEDNFVWRGAQERGMLREFLSDVRWGELELLLVDLPPGPHRLEQLAGLVPGLTGAVAVSLSSGASRSSVERSLRLARSLDVDGLGVVQNMSGYVCSGCGGTGELFPGRAGRELADHFDVPFLGEVPFDPRAAELADAGEMERLLQETRAGEALREVAGRLWKTWEA